MKILKLAFTGVDLREMSFKEVGKIYLSRFALLCTVPASMLIFGILYKIFI